MSPFKCITCIKNYSFIGAFWISSKHFEYLIFLYTINPTSRSKYPACIYLLKVNPFWCLYCYLWTYFAPCSSVSIVNFVQVNAGWVSVILKLAWFLFIPGMIKLGSENFSVTYLKFNNYLNLASYCIRRKLISLTHLSMLTS